MERIATITVEFGDGVLECVGHLSAPEAEAISVSADSTVEHASVIYIDVVRDGRVICDDEIWALPPGRYLVDDSGLYHRLDYGSPTNS